MKTKDVLEASEAELSATLKLMKIKELEKHAKNMIKLLGDNNTSETAYDKAMRSLLKIIPTLTNENEDRILSVKKHLAESLNLAANDSSMSEEVHTRLTVIMMLLVSKKFSAILDKR